MELVYDTKERRMAELKEAIDSKRSWNNIYRCAKDRVQINSPQFHYYSDNHQRTTFELNELKIQLHRLQHPEYGRQ